MPWQKGSYTNWYIYIIMDFVSGEKLQLIAELYVGSNNDFTSNPFIYNNPDAKHIVDLRQLSLNNEHFNKNDAVFRETYYITKKDGTIAVNPFKVGKDEPAFGKYAGTNAKNL